MKQLLPVFILALIVIVGCKRDTQDNTKPTNPTDARHPVKVSIADFSQQITDLRTGNPVAKVASLNSAINILWFFVYDSAGNWLHYVRQNYPADGAAFGTLTDSLTNGHYNMIVVGSKKYFEINAHYSLGEEDIFPTILYNTVTHFYVGLSNMIDVTDFFSKTVAFDVHSDTMQLEITLERKTAMVELNISDGPPDSLDFIICPTKDIALFSFARDSGYIDHRPYSTYFFDPPTIAKQVGPTKWQFYTVNTQVPFDIVLNANYGLGSNPYNHYKIIHNVRCYRNKKTILTGHFYDTLQNVTVGVNDQWDPVTEDISF